MVSITIDDFNFTLLLNLNYVLPSYKNTIKIHISSNIPNDSNVYPEFWVYQSNSELGLWRLCSFMMDSDSHITMNKGDVDYIQSSLIHLDLQKFINKNITKITSEVYDRNKHKCVCLDKIYNYQLFIYNHCINRDITIPKIDYIMSETMDRPIFEEPFLSLYNEIHCGDPHEDVNKYLQCFSTNLEEQFNMGPISKIDKHIFTFKGKIQSIGDIYSIELNRKVMYSQSKTNSVLLYVLITQLSIYSFDAMLDYKFRANVSNICGKQKHIFPFLLTPKECKVNYYGLYSNYIPCGIFICKLFDYTSQCSKDEQSKQTCIDQYTYIGNRYNNLFPLKQTIESMQSMCSISGGVSHSTRKKRKRTNKKRRITRRKTRKYR